MLVYSPVYGGPVGRGYEQRFESKNEYEQRSESKIAYGPRAKLRTVREQNCVRSESKIAESKNAQELESKNAYELRAVVYIGFGITPFVFFASVTMAFPRAVNIPRQRKAAILDP